MTDIKTEFVKNRYTEIENTGNGQFLVRDQVSQQVYVKKTLDVYSVPVFTYLKEHHDPHIPMVADYWEDNGKLIVIEELISGRTLEYLLENNLISETQKMDLMEQICNGVAALHQAAPKIIHRDLKASNIMVTNDNIVKIIDYDAAKIFRADESKDTILIGTEGSAAPEQYGFMPSDERTDIYALGILMKQMFPHNAHMLQIAAKASSFAPGDRYSSVTEMKKEINNGFQAGLVLRNIPGLRSPHPATKIFSGFLYVVLILTVFSNRNLNDPKDILASVCFLMVALGWVDLFGHWTGLFDRFPLTSHARKSKRILGYILAATVIFLFWAMVDGTLQSLLK